MDLLSNDALYKILLFVPPMLLQLTVHEYAHARVALAFGDPTAASLGRVSFNPLRHLDLVGTLAFILTQMVGWGKPVPVNPYNLHPPRLGEAMVSAAGPLSNLALAIVSGLLLHLVLWTGPVLPEAVFGSLFAMLYLSFVLNLAVCAFNLTPLFPLDGHHILREILPPRMHPGYMHWQMRYGVTALVLLWVGPGLLHRAHMEVPNPMGWLLDHVIGAGLWVFRL